MLLKSYKPGPAAGSVADVKLIPPINLVVDEPTLVNEMLPHTDQLPAVKTLEVTFMAELDTLTAEPTGKVTDKISPILPAEAAVALDVPGI